MSTTIKRAEKIVERIDELAAISETPGGITRVFGTREFLQGAHKVLGWMKAAGLETRIDAIGNVRGMLRSANSSARTFVLASHIDTVRNAGRFDGPLGVLTGLDLLEQLIGSGQPLPFHIELIAFSDEEGVRFQTTYLGSKVVTGHFDQATLERKDGSGISLSAAITRLNDMIGQPDAGQTGSLMDRLAREAIAPDGWLGYFELHIEQGPVLYEKKIPVGLVTAIAGQMRAEIVFNGIAGHAGTVPMDMRNDALCCAAEFILELEKMAASPAGPDRRAGSLVATVGKLQIENAAGNVIPGTVVCSLDMRSADPSLLSFSYKKSRELAERIAKRRNIALVWNLLLESGSVACDPAMNILLAESVRESGYEVVSLVSGAGHDAVPVSVVAPVTMLFVRCYQGISHNPLENVELEDLAGAITVTDRFLQKLITTWK